MKFKRSVPQEYKLVSKGFTKEQQGLPAQPDTDFKDFGQFLTESAMLP